jgi:hypothetical protein
VFLREPFFFFADPKKYPGCAKTGCAEGVRCKSSSGCQSGLSCCREVCRRVNPWDLDDPCAQRKQTGQVTHDYERRAELRHYKGHVKHNEDVVDDTADSWLKPIDAVAYDKRVGWQAARKKTRELERQDEEEEEEDDDE